MSEQTSLFVAREADLNTLQNAWSKASEGGAHGVRIQSEFGGGRRALVAEFLRNVQATNSDAIIWRVQSLDHDNGLQWLIRMYGSLVANITADVLRRGRVEMVLNSQLPSQTRRVQGWYQQFITTLKEAKADPKTGQVQLRIPQDNPLVGLVEIVSGIATKVPIILDIQAPYSVNSVLPAQVIEALISEGAERKSKLLAILFDETETEATNALHPQPLLNMYERRPELFTNLNIEPWGEAEVASYLKSKDLTSGQPGRIAEIATGRPGFIAELIDILNDTGKLGEDLTSLTLADLAPSGIDESELEVPKGAPEEGKRKHAGPDDAAQIAYFAALLGQAFPSGLVADLGGFERESVDDLIDAMGDLFEEVQFSEEAGSWIYKFSRGSWREAILEKNRSEEGAELARKVGSWMERFLVPRGTRFIARAARVFAENGAPNRARMLRAMGLSQDAPDAWGLAFDTMNYFDELGWPDELRRTVYINLTERMVSQGPIPQAEKIYGTVSEWVAEKDDRELNAWLLFAGSKLDARRQDLYRARDRANDAIALYEALENKPRVSEVLNHLAAIELQDGKFDLALEKATAALETSKVEQDGKAGYLPQVLAQAEFIRGTVARRQGDTKTAIDHFNRASGVAGQTGLGPLAVDSGLALGEALLASRQSENATSVLRRVAGAAQQLGNPVRERSACELLAQAEASRKNFAEAVKIGTRTLQLTQQLRFEQALPIDLYNLGFFHFANNDAKQALPFLEQASSRTGSMGKHPLVKEILYFKGLAQLQTGATDEARTTLGAALEAAREAKDAVKTVASLDALAGIAMSKGEKDTARGHLGQAIDIAGQAELKDQRKALTKKLSSIT